MNDTEKIIAGDRADLLRVLSRMPNSGPDYVRRLADYWEGEAERLAGLRVCVSLHDLYRLRARELRREFSLTVRKPKTKRCQLVKVGTRK